MREATINKFNAQDYYCRVPHVAFEIPEFISESAQCSALTYARSSTVTLIWHICIYNVSHWVLNTLSHIVFIWLATQLPEDMLTLNMQGPN